MKKSQAHKFKGKSRKNKVRDNIPEEDSKFIKQRKKQIQIICEIIWLKKNKKMHKSKDKTRKKKVRDNIAEEVSKTHKAKEKLE